MNSVMCSSAVTLTLVCFKAACHTYLGAEKNEQDESYIFQDIYLESFQIR